MFLRRGWYGGDAMITCSATKKSLLYTYSCDMSPAHDGDHIDVLHFHAWANLPAPASWMEEMVASLTGDLEKDFSNFARLMIAVHCVAALVVVVCGVLA
jgi:hypothetical protein